MPRRCQKPVFRMRRSSQKLTKKMKEKLKEARTFQQTTIDGETDKDHCDACLTPPLDFEDLGFTLETKCLTNAWIYIVAHVRKDNQSSSLRVGLQLVMVGTDMAGKFPPEELREVLVNLTRADSGRKDLVFSSEDAFSADLEDVEFISLKVCSQSLNVCIEAQIFHCPKKPLSFNDLDVQDLVDSYLLSKKCFRNTYVVVKDDYLTTAGRPDDPSCLARFKIQHARGFRDQEHYLVYLKVLDDGRWLYVARGEHCENGKLPLLVQEYREEVFETKGDTTKILPEARKFIFAWEQTRDGDDILRPLDYSSHCICLEKGKLLSRDIQGQIPKDRKYFFDICSIRQIPEPESAERCLSCMIM